MIIKKRKILKRKKPSKNQYRYIGDGTGYRDKGTFYSQIPGKTYILKEEKTEDGTPLISLQGFGSIFFRKKFYEQIK